VTLTQALDIAERSKSPYIRSDVLDSLDGTSSYLERRMMPKQSIKEPSISIESTLSLQATHLVNLAYVLLRQNQISEAEETLKQGRDYAALILGDHPKAATYDQSKPATLRG